MYQPYQQNPYGSRQNGYGNTNFFMQQNTISGRIVNSREEFMGIPMDFQSGVTTGVDLCHGMIYVKVLNPQTGQTNVFTFVREKEEEPPQYVTFEQFEELKKELEALKEEKDK